MADLDLQMGGGGGGGEGVIHTLRKVGGRDLKKKIFRPFGPQFGPKIRGGLEDPPLS